MQTENIERKKCHNDLEDLKGMIRVYARVRPILKFEIERNAKNALSIPDVLTVEHLWKKTKQSYTFNSVFGPDSPQDAVSAPYCQLSSEQPVLSANCQTPGPLNNTQSHATAFGFQ